MRGLLRSIPAKGEPGWFALENIVVRRRGASDWHIIIHAHGGHDVLTHAFAETAARHPTLSATTIAFEEGQSVTVSRHVPGSPQPVSTNRFPAALYDRLEAEFRVEPTDASSLLLSPVDLDTITLDTLRERFGG